jgi:hypothetical protein
MMKRSMHCIVAKIHEHLTRLGACTSPYSHAWMVATYSGKSSYAGDGTHQAQTELMSAQALIEDSSQSFRHTHAKP